MARAKSTAATSEKKTTPRTKKATNGNGHAQPVPANVEEQIRARAYELYESRGRQHGSHEKDWFTAEAEVRTRTA